MKTLKESLFDRDLVTKDPLDNPKFKKWINRPDILWWLYFYWEEGVEDGLSDFSPNEWKMYKPLVDGLIEIIDDQMHKAIGPKKWSWIALGAEEYYIGGTSALSFESEDEYEGAFTAAMSEIYSKSTQQYDGVSKTWFKGPMPKNSSVTYFLEACGVPFAEPGKVDGGIFLTNGDFIVVMAFPKGLSKNILKVFDIK